MPLVEDVAELRKDVTEIKERIAGIEVKLAMYAGLGSLMGGGAVALVVKALG